MAKPEKNTYVLTVILRDVSKVQAMDFADKLELVSEEVGASYPEVITAHVKDES